MYYIIKFYYKLTRIAGRGTNSDEIDKLVKIPLITPLIDKKSHKVTKSHDISVKNIGFVMNANGSSPIVVVVALTYRGQ